MESLGVRSLLRSRVCHRCIKALQAQRRRFATAKAAEQYDVVCVGGGPAGLSLLTALRADPRTSSLKLALIESQDLAPASKVSLPPDKFSNRCSSLTPASKGFLTRVGAWQKLKESRIQAYERMEVWDGVSGSRIDFDWQYDLTRQTKTIAYMNENSNLVQALLTRLSELKGCSIFDNTRVADISLGSPSQIESGPDLSAWPHITLSSGQSIAARLLVGADGFNSPVRTFADIPSHGWDYGRHGLVATLRLSDLPAAPITAYQRFLPTGPVAMLPLPGQYATLVWSTTADRAAHLKTLASEDFISMVNAAFRLSPVDLAYMHTMSSGQGEELAWRLQHTTTPIEGKNIPHWVSEVQEGSVASFPLRFRHADTYATHRVALVGDAAHTTHPLAGQGLNMGIGDVESLANAIGFAAEHGMDVGDQLSLERYNSERYAANHMLLGVVDKLHKLYSVGGGPLVGLRSLGLDAVNKLPLLKNVFMKQAAGGS